MMLGAGVAKPGGPEPGNKRTIVGKAWDQYAALRAGVCLDSGCMATMSKGRAGRRTFPP